MAHSKCRTLGYGTQECLIDRLLSTPILFKHYGSQTASHPARAVESAQQHCTTALLHADAPENGSGTEGLSPFADGSR